MKRNFLILLFFSLSLTKGFTQDKQPNELQKDSIPKMKYPFTNFQEGSLYLNNPADEEVKYDPSVGRYVVRERIGRTSFGLPRYYTEEEYKNYRLRKDIHKYFRDKSAAVDGKKKGSKEAQKDLLPTMYVNNKFFETLFGGTEIKLVPRGSLTVNIGGFYQKIENPLLSEDNQSNFTPNFEQQIRANLSAKVGKVLTAEVNYDTQSTFSFQNQLKLDFQPNEDNLIQKLEVGNINMDIKNNLINGSQSLFGVKAQFQFGPTTITGVFSQQQSQAKNIVAEGASALTEFELRTTQYDNNRHFFISQYFRNTYNDALERLPLINSNIQVTKIEVWVTNRNTNTQDVRNIVGLVDLGEAGKDRYDITKSNISSTNVVEEPITGDPNNVLPDNKVNSLKNYIGTNVTALRDVQNVTSELAAYRNGSDYAIVENARQLRADEFTFNRQLGYISLNARLNDGDILAVAFEYLENGEVHRVGELSTDGISSDDNIVVKLLRPQLINTEEKVWDLMMKNVYNIGAYNLDKEGFRFSLLYREDATGQATNNLLNAKGDDIKERTILNATRLDRLDANNNLTRIKEGKDYQKGDGFFDFIEGITVNSRNGAIIFPTIEPFGRDLENILEETEDKEKYPFNELYTTTASVAENDYQNKDKFFVTGLYTSSGDDGIPLGAFNVPRGSVTVTSGGIPLIEGVDYTVDYFAGRVKVINPAIKSSGQAINVSLENNTFFNQQQKTFIGVDVEHKFTDKFVLGATYLNIRERPISNKVQLGQDPINNSMYGLNVNYSGDVPFLTDMVNYLPNIDTDAPSTISVRGDIAYLKPGTPSSIDIGGEATTYVDDFEGAQIPINMGVAQNWSMASTPLVVGDENKYNGLIKGIENGKKRGKLAWYNIDQLFYGRSGLKPANIDTDELSRAETRPIGNNELFPERNLDVTQRNNVRTFDLTYYPNERGPYNYSEPVREDGPEEVANPEQNWAGITRGLVTTDFQRSNIQYIEFWLQDPYDKYSIKNGEGIVANPTPTNQKGTLYFDLGNVSEDILSDDRKSFENGLPEDGDLTKVLYTDVSHVSKEKSLLYAFGAGDDARSNQDVGYDGMKNQTEVDTLRGRIPDALLTYRDLNGNLDPSFDNYQFFRGETLDRNNASILQRYKNYNNPEGNSPTAGLNRESFPSSATNNPDVEDVDRDQTMNTLNAYWQYKVDLSQNNLSKARNQYIIDEKNIPVTLENGNQENFKWYLFRIPISDGQSLGGINNFQTIRFMRMFLTDFEIPINLRFAEMQLVRGDWRIYEKIIDENNLIEDRDPDAVENRLETGVVNFEENENRVPINYTLPPTITRERLQGTSNVLQQNEQSLVVRVDKLQQDNTVGVYKNVNVDMRMFKRLKMFMHTEELQLNTVSDDDLVAVIRLGSDTNDNFYQVEIPLKVTKVDNLATRNVVSADLVWPEESNLDIALKDLVAVKLARDNAKLSASEIYTPTENNGTVISVKGNPNLSNVRTIFLGVKNADVTEKSAEIWFNELRMAGFDNQGGWATTVSADATIADFAKISATGGYQSIGFGNIDQTVNERSQEEIKGYSVNTSVNVGQLLPKKWNVRIPVNYTVSEEIRTPKFDPRYEDVQVKGSDVDTKNIEVKNKRRGISFINVKKDRTTGSLRKPKIYDIENFSVSYSYSDALNESYVIEKDLKQNVNASANYSFKFKQIEIRPFKKSKLFNSKRLKLLKDFNFNLLPTDITVNSNINRTYNEFKSRDLLETAGLEIPTLKQRNFMFNWDYRVGYQLSDAINLSFNANNSYVYDAFESDGNLTEDEIDQIGIYSNFFEIGRPTNYNQNLTATYKLPINKIPFLSFVNADYSYTGNFNWQAASPDFEAIVGNSISNGATHNLTGNLDFSKFYKEIGLKKLFASKKSLNRNAKKKVSAKDIIYGVLTSVKQGRVSYTKNLNSSLNGYTPQVGFLGRNRFNGTLAPSLGYVFGWHNTIDVVDRTWLIGQTPSDDTRYNRIFSANELTNLDYSLTLKPIKDLNIQLTANRSFTENSQQQFINSEGVDGLELAPRNDSGNFNISYSLIRTALGSNPETLFNTFRENRAKILSEIHPGADVNDPQALNSQQVLIQSFLAAYSGKEVSNGTIFRKIPVPNWQLTYKGLMRLDFFKRNFSNFTLTHGYNSSYTINNFATNLNSDESNPYQSSYIYSGVTLTDAFSPLIKLDVKLKNSFTVRGVVNTSRSLSLNLNNATLSEMVGSEFVFGLGYRFKDVKFKSRFFRKTRILKGDINIKADVSYRTDETYIRSVDAESNQPVGGQNLLGIKVAADYNLSRNFTASLYYDQNVTSYAISTLYPRQSINAGISLVYNLGR
ncbi:T9SS outer membrane translocon Sov/SprA [Wenyingzhuangia sp. IMCC45574]